MTIELIKLAIDTRVKALAEKENINPKEEVLVNILTQISIFLEQSNNGINVEKLQQALTYIASMPIEDPEITDPELRFFKPIPLMKEMRKEPDVKRVYNRKLFEQMNDEHGFEQVYKPPGEAVAEEGRVLLRKLYKSIQKELPVWSFDYPRHAFDEALSKGWQKKGSGQALGDFKRSAKIEGVFGGDEESADDRIDKFMEKAKGYSKEGRDNIGQWIKDNGGQAMVSFALTNAIHDEHHFGAQEMTAQISKDLTDWKMINGQPVAEILIVVSSLQIFERGSDAFLTAKETGGVHKVSDVPEEDFAYQSKQRDQNLPMPKLLVFKAQIRLAVDEYNNVTPVLTHCRVTSYSEELHRPTPERFGINPQVPPEDNGTPKPL